MLVVVVVFCTRIFPSCAVWLKIRQFDAEVDYHAQCGCRFDNLTRKWIVMCSVIEDSTIWRGCALSCAVLSYTAWLKIRQCGAAVDYYRLQETS